MFCKYCGNRLEDGDRFLWGMWTSGRRETDAGDCKEILIKTGRESAPHQKEKARNLNMIIV